MLNKVNIKEGHMEPLSFIYWLQGFLELQNPTSLNEEQIKEIKNHIGLVLHKTDFPYIEYDHISSYIARNQDKIYKVDTEYGKNFIKYAVEIIEPLHSC